MKKFVKLTLIFVLPIMVSLVALEFSLRNIPNDYSYKKNYLDKNSGNIEVLYLGSSHMYFGINPKFSKFNSFNAANIAQSLNYDIEILKMYEGKMKSLQYIVMPIDYFSLYRTLETGVEKWRIKNYNIYYGMDKSNSLENNFELLNGKFQKNINRTLKYYVFHKSDMTCNKFGWGTTYSSKKKLDLAKTGKAAAKRHTKENDTFFEESEGILNEIIAIAKAKNAKVIFYTSPATKQYAKNLETGQLQTTVNIVTSLAKNNPNVKYYNFLNDPSFSDKDFFDADHLNEIGAKKFTIKLDSIIAFQR